jgi:outer membrane protein
MSQQELDKRTGEIQDRVKELQKKAAEFQARVAEEQASAGEDILKLAQQVITGIAKDKKLSAVFERTRSGLLFIEDSLDLTDEVIRRLNTESSQAR